MVEGTGESARGLLMCGTTTATRGWLKFIGLKHTVLVGVISSVNNGWEVNDELRAMYL